MVIEHHNRVKGTEIGDWRLELERDLTQVQLTELLYSLEVTYVLASVSHLDQM